SRGTMFEPRKDFRDQQHPDSPTVSCFCQSPLQIKLGDDIIRQDSCLRRFSQVPTRRSRRPWLLSEYWSTTFEHRTNMPAHWSLKASMQPYVEIQPHPIATTKKSPLQAEEMHCWPPVDQQQ